MADLPLQQPNTPDIYSYGFGRVLNRDLKPNPSSIVYDIMSGLTEAQLVRFGTLGVGGGSNNFRVDAKDGLWLGAEKFSDAPFKASISGALTATNAILTGSITAASGNIGGFTLSATTISANANLIKLDSGDSSVTASIATVGSLNMGPGQANIDINNTTGTTYQLIADNANATSGVAVALFRQEDIDKTILALNNNDAQIEDNIGLLEISGASSSNLDGIYIVMPNGRAHLRINSVTAPAVPVEGQLWYDGTNLIFRDSTTSRVISWT